jgi:hypothetical protein
MLYLHYLLTVIVSICIIFFPYMNKFRLNIINSNIYLRVLSIIIIFILTLENYLLGILVMIMYFLITGTNSKEINEGFLDYYKKKSLDKY